MASDSVFIDQLVVDARLLGSYGQRTGSFDPSRLLPAASKVEVPSDKVLDASEVNEPKKLVSEAQELLPKVGGSSIWLDLKAGWMPFMGPNNVRKPAYRLIALSIILVITIGQLTLVYNQGTVLLSDLRVLRATEPERRAGQLSRQLIAAMKEIAAAKTSATLTGKEPLPPTNGGRAGCVQRRREGSRGSKPRPVRRRERQ